MAAYQLPVVPSGLGDYGDANPSGAFAYDVGYPSGMGDARTYVGQDTPGGAVSSDGLMLLAADTMDVQPASSSLAYLRGEHAHVGGQTGVRQRNGFSDGTRKYDRNVHHFTGRYLRFLRQNVGLRGGPVGRSNYSGKLASGVDQQYSATMPSLEDIARGFTGK